MFETKDNVRLLFNKLSKLRVKGIIMSDTVDNSPEMHAGMVDVVISSSQVIDLPGDGKGTISLAERLATGEIKQEDVDALVDDVRAGKYSKRTDVAEVTKCGDGRGSSEPIAGTQGFGGSAGIAKSLRIAGVMGEGFTAAEDVSAFVKERTTRSKASGGHRADTHGNPDSCGCGECDGAQDAAKLVVEAPDRVEGFTTTLSEALGVQDRFEITAEKVEAEFAGIVSNYAFLVESDYFADGPAMINAIDEADPENTNIEILDGDHKEVLWVINTVENTTIDREKLVADYEKKGINVFWEDQWAIEAELSEYCETDEQMNTAVVADLARRISTADNLTKTDLKVVILS